jgi:hypothetical protein
VARGDHPAFARATNEVSSVAGQRVRAFCSRKFPETTTRRREGRRRWTPETRSRRDIETRDERGAVARHALVEELDAVLHFLRSGREGEGQDRRRLRVREIRQRSDDGGRASLSARTVVAFANTCCIMASFSAGESLDMSTGVPCCAIVTRAARRRSGDPGGFPATWLARGRERRSAGGASGRLAKRHVSAFCFGKGRPNAVPARPLRCARRRWRRWYARRGAASRAVTRGRGRGKRW